MYFQNKKNISTKGYYSLMKNKISIVFYKLLIKNFYFQSSKKVESIKSDWITFIFEHRANIFRQYLLMCTYLTITGLGAWWRRAQVGSEIAISLISNGVVDTVYSTSYNLPGLELIATSATRPQCDFGCPTSGSSRPLLANRSSNRDIAPHAAAASASHSLPVMAPRVKETNVYLKN